MNSAFKNTDMYQQYYNTTNNQSGGSNVELIGLDNITNEYIVGSDTSGVDRFKSEDNIDDIDRLMELVRMLIDRAWGEETVTIIDEYPTNQDADSLKMPMIVYDHYDRVYMEKTRKAPNIMETIKDSIDSYDILSEFFECTLQFDICSETTRSAKIITKKFETFLQSYIQYFKYVGISQMYFEKEIKAVPFVRSNQEYPRRTLLYHVRLERRYIRKPGEALTNVSIVLGLNSNINTGSSSNELPGIYNELGITLPKQI